MSPFLFILSRALGLVLRALILVLISTVAVVVGLFMLTPIGWLLWPFIGAYLNGFMRRLNRRRVALVLSHVRQALDLSLPLPEFLAAAAKGETPRTSRQLNNVASAIALGAQVSHAIHAGAPQLTDRQATLLLSAERAGSLNAALITLDNQRRRLDTTDHTQAGALYGYPFMLLAAMGLIFTFIMVLIVPKFEKIMDDHGVAMPVLSRAVFSFGRWLGGRLYPDQIVPGAIWVVLAILAVLLALAASQWQVTRRKVGPWLWRLPLLGDGERAAALADACHTITLWLRAGAPLDRAFHEASGLAINSALTQSLARCADLLTQGVPFPDALRQSGFPAHPASILASAHATGSLAEAFDFLARHYDHHAHRFLILARAAATPAMLLAIAALEACIVVGLFLPLITMIHNLT